MRFEEPPKKGQSIIKDLGTELWIVIPYRPRNLPEWVVYSFVILFISGWLIGWTAGGISAFKEFLAEWSKGEVSYFLGGWLLGWVAGEVFGAVILVGILGMLLGFIREEITVTPERVSIVFRPFHPRHYRLSEVSNLRALEVAGESGTVGQWHHSIAFDYGLQTIQFGRGLDPAEARQIVALIKERFGRYMKPDKASP